MKKIICIVLLGIISSIFCGASSSKEQIPAIARYPRKIKIGSKETLIAIFSKTLNTDDLNQMGVIDAFADKELYENQLEDTVYAAFNSCWAHRAPQIERQIGKEQFELTKEVQYGNFMRRCLEINTLLLAGIRESAKVHTPKEDKSQN